MSLKKKFSKSKPSCKVTFTLPKEAVNGGKEVVLVGSFNNWDIESGVQMKAAKKEFKAELDLAAGQNYEFRYLIDKQTWENDWNADDYVPTPFGVDNSVVFVPETAAVITNSKPATKKVTGKKATAKKTVAKKATTKKAVTKKSTVSKTTTVKDDLKKIEGIGPKIAGLLNKAGIRTFAELAKASQRTLKSVLDAAGPRFKMHEPTTWPRQAKMAAKGDWTALKSWQDELKGGRA